MWGRTIEIMTAVWLAFSPFIFGSEDVAHLILVDSLVALAIASLAGFSFWKPTRYAHLLILAVATGLIVYGRIDGTPPPAAHQNHIATGLFLLMIAIIPNDASHPPLPWRRAATE